MTHGTQLDLYNIFNPRSEHVVSILRICKARLFVVYADMFNNIYQSRQFALNDLDHALSNLRFTGSYEEHFQLDNYDCKLIAHVLWANRALYAIAVHVQLARLCVLDLFRPIARWFTIFYALPARTKSDNSGGRL